MRALYYFYLVRIFGDVPKITTVQSELGELQVSRAPVKEIYDEIIIPDLLEAEQPDLAFSDHTGRVSMGAVKALLAVSILRMPVILCKEVNLITQNRLNVHWRL